MILFYFFKSIWTTDTALDFPWVGASTVVRRIASWILYKVTYAFARQFIKIYDHFCTIHKISLFWGQLFSTANLFKFGHICFVRCRWIPLFLSPRLLCFPRRPLSLLSPAATVAGDVRERGTDGCSCRFAAFLRLYAVWELSIDVSGWRSVVVGDPVCFLSLVELGGDNRICRRLL